MFGYVRAHNAELKVKEYEAYRGVYCGLCRSMGKCTGQCSRMTLSFDFAFLALLRICFSGERVEFESRRCIAHPLKKRSMMKRTATLEYCARAAAILNYHKIKDDLSDERGVKKLKAMLVYPFVAHSRKKAIKTGELSALDEVIRCRIISKMYRNFCSFPLESCHIEILNREITKYCNEKCSEDKVYNLPNNVSAKFSRGMISFELTKGKEEIPSYPIQILNFGENLIFDGMYLVNVADTENQDFG